MNLKHIVPVPGKVALHKDGSKIDRKTPVDIDDPFYKKRLKEGAFKLWVKPKQAKEAKKDA